MNNKYKRLYDKIIANAISQNREVGSNIEKHHIIPKSLGGGNIKENIVLLTCKEHFVCHWLLTKFISNEFYRKKMLKAFGSMCMNKSGNRILSSMEYQKAKASAKKGRTGVKRPEQSKFMREHNPFKGKHHSEESKRKIISNRKRTYIGKDNPMYGRTGAMFGKRHSQETKEKCRLANIGRHAKEFSFISPEGEVITGKNIAAFSKQHGLDRSSLFKLRNGTLQCHRGWKLCI